ncbi:1626_t:CDS:1, partial [Funneliformis mosseae]
KTWRYEFWENNRVRTEKLEETKKGDKKKVLKLAMDENEYVTKLWKAIRKEERKL